MDLASMLLAAGFALQPVGTFHGDEPVARAGERWLALHVTPTGMQLRPARVETRTVHDPIVDAEGEASGIEVLARGLPAATMLLRGGSLRAGPVETAAVASDAGEDLARFDFRGATYRLRTRCPEALPSPDASQACDVVLAGPRGEQAVATRLRWRRADGAVGFDEDSRPALLHAGDFDRDGHVDLILDTTDHYNLWRPTLLLSSPSGGGGLRAIAAHESVGC
jgi:hypothetical protein